MDLFSFIKQNVAILDITSEHIRLKQMGNYWKGSCPFHSETDASFTVSPDKQIFYCFGCQASGDVIGFVAKLENISQIEAAKVIVEQRQLEIPEEIKQQGFRKAEEIKQVHEYFDICKYVASWAHQELLKSSSAQNYLIQRGVSSEQIKRFVIGYFPGGIGNVRRLLKECSNHAILAKDILATGIIAEGKSVLYSGFEERIIFPIRDSLGRFCGFGGRVFKSGDERAKYYNSRDSEGFAKSKLLFGLDLAKKSFQKEQSAFLVEGYLDCIAMAQHGWPNTVATLGTACTIEHLKLLSRSIKSLYLLYDGDKAGIKAILRIAQLCWEVNLDVYVVLLPSKYDPASFLQDGQDLAPLVAQAKSLFSFFVEVVAAGFIQKSLSEKMAMAEKIVSLIGKIKDDFKRDLLLQQAATEMQMPFNTLRSFLSKNKEIENRRERIVAHKKESEQEASTSLHPENNNKNNDVTLLEEKIFSAIINSVNSRDKLIIDTTMLEYFSVRVRDLLYRLFAIVNSSHDEDDIYSRYLEGLDEHDRQWVLQASLKFDTIISKELFEQFLSHFYKSNWKYIVGDIKRKITLAKQRGDADKQRALVTQFLTLKKDMQNRGLV